METPVWPEATPKPGWQKKAPPPNRVQCWAEDLFQPGFAFQLKGRRDWRFFEMPRPDQTKDKDLFVGYPLLGGFKEKQEENHQFGGPDFPSWWS